MAAMYDVIVLGVGGFGSAVLLNLARRGLKVLGLDRFGIGHDRGSSHGETRIIRKAYFEHPDYVPLLERTYELWDDLEQHSHTLLYTPCGLFLAGSPDGEAVAGTREAARLHSLVLEDVSLSEARNRFPNFVFHEDQEVVFERQAGTLDVERCVLTHVLQAHEAGAECAIETVLNWSADAQTIRVRTNCNEYEAGALVITAGAWARELLGDLGVPLTVLRKPQFWHRVDHADWTDSPAFFLELPDGCFYGFPSRDGESIKIAEHTGGDVVDDPTGVDRTFSPGESDAVETFVQQTLRHVEPHPLRHSVCLYTMSPDGHFLIDRHPEHANVVFGAGFSGHGFKFTPVIGEALADLVIDRTTSLPIDFLRLNRPSLNVS